MSKRITPESVAVKYFETAPLETAQAVLSICTSKMKERVRASQPTPAPRAKRKAKTNANAHGSATSFPGSEVQATA